MCSFVEACENVFIIQYLLLLGGRRARVLAQDDLNEASILLPDWKQKLQYKLLEVVPTSNRIMCLFNSMTIFLAGLEELFWIDPIKFAISPPLYAFLSVVTVKLTSPFGMQQSMRTAETCEADRALINGAACRT